IICMSSVTLAAPTLSSNASAASGRRLPIVAVVKRAVVRKATKKTPQVPQEAMKPILVAQAKSPALLVTTGAINEAIKNGRATTIAQTAVATIVATRKTKLATPETNDKARLPAKPLSKNA